VPILRDCAIWYGGFDLTSAANEVNIDSSFATVPVTTFADSGNVKNVAGLEDATVNVMTFLEPAISEPAITGNRGGAIELFTACAFPTGGTVTAGDRVYAMRGLLKSFKDPLKVGDAARIDATLQQAQAEGLLAGMVLSPSTAVTSSGTGTSVSLGAQSATQTAYFGVHVLAATGNRTITAKLQSASSSGFGSPNDRVTLGSISAIGSGFGTSTTATTDANWRVSYTIGGSTGSLTFAAFAAIQ
jgi:hypothetical protein